MTIDEHIAKAEQDAKQAEFDTEWGMGNYFIDRSEALEYAKECRQLANWLKELKQLREQTKWIPVSERLPEKDDQYICTVKFKHDDGYPDVETHAVDYTKAYGGWDMGRFLVIVIRR